MTAAASSADLFVLLLGMFASCTVVGAIVSVRQALGHATLRAALHRCRAHACSCQVRYVVVDVTSGSTERGMPARRVLPAGVRASHGGVIAQPRALPARVAI